MHLSRLLNSKNARTDNATARTARVSNRGEMMLFDGDRLCDLNKPRRNQTVLENARGNRCGFETRKRAKQRTSEFPGIANLVHGSLFFVRAKNAFANNQTDNVGGKNRRNRRNKRRTTRNCAEICRFVCVAFAPELPDEKQRDKQKR